MFEDTYDRGNTVYILFVGSNRWVIRMGQNSYGYCCLDGRNGTGSFWPCITQRRVSGFGMPVVVMIAGLFVVGEGLFRTGIAASAGQWLLNVGGQSEVRLLLFLIPIVALLSAFMSSTGAVALLIPVVLSISRKSGMFPSKLLMPLAFASLVGGMLTLIGTPPNIVVSSQMAAAGYAPFGFFDFTPIGLVILVVTMIYLIFIGRRILPNKDIRNPDQPHLQLHEFAERYGISDQMHLLSVTAGSELIRQTVSEAGLRTHYEVTVFGVNVSRSYRINRSAKHGA